jgi:ABC-type transporter Mla subunit MlaD
MIWSLLIEGLLVLLLTATIYFAIRLNKRLTVLRVEKEQLEKLITQFELVADRAHSSLSGLRATADQVKSDLDDATNKSHAMRDELAFLIERADINAEKLAKLSSSKTGNLAQDSGLDNEQSVTTNSQENFENIQSLANERDNEEIFDQNMGVSEVERELITALKRAR